MACLIANLPSVEVWVRKEYLTDHQSGHGEFEKGVWVSAKSIPGRAFYFETYYQSMGQCMINYRSVPLYQNQRHLTLI